MTATHQNSHQHRYARGWLIMLAVALAPTLGLAQGAAPTVTGGLEEIVVTAQRRAENVQDVPISITAFTNSRLRELGVQETRDLPLVTPGLVISQIGSAQVTLRGVSTSNLNLSGDPGVGVYIDDIYIARASAAFQNFFDQDRVEVLRGPQGTLFGRNTPGGVISIFSPDPEPELNGFLTATVGNESLRRAEGAVGGALGDERLSGRIAAVVEERDGWLDNLFDGRDVDDKDLFGVRGSLKYQPSDGFAATLRVDYGEDKGTGSVFKAFTPGLANFIGGTSPFDQEFAINADEPFTKDTENRGASLRMDWNFSPGWTLTSITGYREHETADTGDLDDTELSTAFFENYGYSETLQQEVQLTSDTIAGLTWISGVFAWWEDANASLDFPFPVFGIRPLTLSEIDTFSIAAFAQGTYSVSDRLRLTAGVRYTRDDKDFRRDFSLIPIFTNAIDTADRKDDAWTPRLGVDYFIRENAMLYVNYTRGFKSGGFNGAGRQPDYAPEFLSAYEAGLKSTWLAGRMQLNVVGFWYDYTDVQALRIVQAGSAIDNAAEGTIKGGEVELTATPIDGFTARLAVAYLDATYDQYITNDPLNNNAEVSLEGNYFPRSPEWTFNGGLDYSTRIADAGTLSIHADGQHRSRIYFDQFNRRNVSEGPITIVNARVTFRTSGDRWSVSAYARNLTDEYYTESKFAIAESGGTVLGIVAPPRNYGLEVGFNF
jgi:iron complex outermembrane receptor protein